jgi:hypothetical protein
MGRDGDEGLRLYAEHEAVVAVAIVLDVTMPHELEPRCYRSLAHRGAGERVHLESPRPTSAGESIPILCKSPSSAESCWPSRSTHFERSNV